MSEVSSRKTRRDPNGWSTPVEAAALYLCLACLLIGCAISVQSAWKWPLVGDASLIRYVIFLLHNGKVPYVQIIDINLPGSYLIEYVAIKLFGWGAHGLRIYDGFLCAILVTLSYLAGNKSKRESLFCLAGGLLFVLIHLQDGLEQAGQRDYAMAVLAVSAVVLLIRTGRLTLQSLFLFELLIGCSLTIKPTLLPMAFLPLLLSDAFAKRSPLQTLAFCAVVFAGIALPIVLMLAWLRSYNSVDAFYAVLRSVDLLHGTLGRRSTWFRVLHCMSPISILFVVWLILISFNRPPLDNTRKLFLGALLCGFLSYFMQGKGLPYQRYPFLAVAVILVFLDYSRAMKLGGIARVFALASLLFVSFSLVPKLTSEILSFDSVAPFQDTLRHALDEKLKGRSVQCLDTYGGCINALYDARVTQATGYLYDCYLFTPPSEVREDYRMSFLKAFNHADPAVVILTDDQCFASNDSFARVGNWPALNELLTNKYYISYVWSSKESYRWWSRPEHPNSYMVYMHR